MYRVLVDRRVEKELDGIPDYVYERVEKAILRLKGEPRPFGVKKLKGKNDWRLRVGDYRMLYVIDDERKVVKIYRVKHRKEVYRRYKKLL